MTLDELDRLEKAATKAPWVWSDKHEGGVSGGGQHYANVMDFGEQRPYSESGDVRGEPPNIEDRELMLAARNALPKLLAVAKAAREIRHCQHTLDAIQSGASSMEPDDVVAHLWMAVEALDAALAEMEKA
jgi:hypothetical protein